MWWSNLPVPCCVHSMFGSVALGTICHALQRTGALEASVHMLSFEGHSMTPLRLMGTAPWLPVLHEVSKLRFKAARKSPVLDRLAETTVSSDGRPGYTGQKGSLDRSAGYTKAFGQAVAWCDLGLSAMEVAAKLQGVPGKRARTLRSGCRD